MSRETRLVLVFFFLNKCNLFFTLRQGFRVGPSSFYSPNRLFSRNNIEPSGAQTSDFYIDGYTQNTRPKMPFLSIKADYISNSTAHPRSYLYYFESSQKKLNPLGTEFVCF